MCFEAYDSKLTLNYFKLQGFVFKKKYDVTCHYYLNQRKGCSSSDDPWGTGDTGQNVLIRSEWSEFPSFEMAKLIC